MEVSFTYHYVLFLDILGYKELVVRSAASISSEKESIQNLHEAFLLARSRYVGKEGYNVKQFSDSVILTAPYDDVQADEFVRECAYLQVEMLKRGILTRGGIAVGKHFQSEDFVASQGVIEAYEVEQSISKFPRVVLPENFIELVYSDGNYSGSPLARFVDGATFVDFLRHDGDPVSTRTSLAALWSNASRLPWAAREKLSWLVEYWNCVHPDHTITLPPRFDFF